MQEICLAFHLALDSAGSNSDARMAMIAMTTKSSISVNALNLFTSCFGINLSLMDGKNNRIVEVNVFDSNTGICRSSNGIQTSPSKDLSNSALLRGVRRLNFAAVNRLV